MEKNKNKKKGGRKTGVCCRQSFSSFSPFSLLFLLLPSKPVRKEKNLLLEDFPLHTRFFHSLSVAQSSHFKMPCNVVVEALLCVHVLCTNFSHIIFLPLTGLFYILYASLYLNLKSYFFIFSPSFYMPGLGPTLFLT